MSDCKYCVCDLHPHKARISELMCVCLARAAAATFSTGLCFTREKLRGDGERERESGRTHEHPSCGAFGPEIRIGENCTELQPSILIMSSKLLLPLAASECLNEDRK